ncbi:leucine-rich repeat-containing protein 53, partial [Silurus asotus]
TKALMLTDGSIDTVDHIASSDLSNMSVLVLSNNIISNIVGNAFQNLTALRTLSLDHNLLSSTSLDRLTFSWLHKLETLHLGHNSIKEIRGSWFQNTNSLKTLLLEGNLLSFLNSSTFASSDLRSLETLDLSDNLISFVGRDSFRNLPRLGSLDLSRNRLQNVPDAFSYLLRLSMLNLDLNHWNCSCELRELARFLNSYIQSPDKVLYNGKTMACAGSDNPKVQTVLEINEANCMPANGNMMADINATSSITSQRYTRDVAIAVVFSCLGGVLITLAILALLHRKLGRRFHPTQKTKGAEEPSSQTWDFSEGKVALSMSYALQNSNNRDHPQWDKEDTSSETRPDTIRNHFICQNCGLTSKRKAFHQRTNRGIRPNVEEEWSTYLDRWKDTDFCPKIKDEDGSLQRHKVKSVSGLNTDHPRQRSPREDTSTLRMQQIALRRHMSIAQRQTSIPEEEPNAKISTHKNHSFFKHQYRGGYGVLPVQHHPQTYMDDIQDNMPRNQEEHMLPRHSKVILYKDTLNYNQSNMEHQDGTQARIQRSVTFDLSMERALYVSRKEGPYKISRTKMSEALQLKSKSSPGKESKQRKGNTQSRNSKTLKLRSQRHGKLKVKLNLNPLKKSQVSPKSGSDSEAKDVKRTPKKIKNDKSQKSGTKKQSEGQKSGSDAEAKDVKKTPKKIKKDKSQKSEAKKESEGQKTEEKYPNSEKSQCEESSVNPLEIQSYEKNPEESSPPMQTSNLLAETTEPLGTKNTKEHSQIPSLDLSLALGAPEDAKESLQKEFQTPQDGEVLPDDFMTPGSSMVSVVQEYLSSGDGSPKRKIRLIVPEKSSNRPKTALEKKIR